MTDRQSERQTWLLKMRAEWFRVLRPLGGWVPWELRELVEQSAEPGEAHFWGAGTSKKLHSSEKSTCGIAWSCPPGHTS
jgi:hypothetical protein